MQLTPEELATEEYILLEKLDHQELIPFVQKYLRQPTFSSRFYYASNLIIVIVMGVLVKQYVSLSGANWWDALSYLAMGIGFSLLLIPLHEYIHALAYRWAGASQTSFDMNLRKFYFLAVADRFVASRKEFRIIALAPFVLISLTLLLLVAVTSPHQTLILMGALLMHTAACSGDFGLMSFYDSQKGKTILTYDDKANKISYFYEKVS